MAEVRLFTLQGSPLKLLADAIDVKFTIDLEELGFGSFAIPAASPTLRSDPSLFDARRIVQVTRGHVTWHWLLEGEDAWERLSGGRSTGLPRPLSGDGLLAVFGYTPVLPAGGLTTRVVDERVFGPMSPGYDDSWWDDVVAFASWRSQDFSPSPRMAEGFPFAMAEIISADLGELPPGYYWFRHEWTAPETGLYTVAVSADDEVLECWVAEVQLREVETSGEHQWRSWASDSIYLTEDETVVTLILVHNLDRTGATGNPDSLVRLLYGAGLTAEDGKPLAANDIHALWVTADGGDYTLNVNGVDTAAIVPGAASSTLRTAIEAVVGAGNVEVTGSGDTATNQVTELWVEAIGGTFPIIVEGLSTDQLPRGATAGAVEAAIEGLPNVDGCTVTGGGTTEGDPYRITFDGLQAQQSSFSVTSNETNLTGTDPQVHITTAVNASEDDPYLVELVGAYANAQTIIAVDPSNLTGGTATVQRRQTGGGGRDLDRTEVTGWKVLANPDQLGLTPHEIVSIIVTEGIDWGSLPAGVRLTSTPTHDSGGVEWEARVNWRFPTFDTSLLHVLLQLREMAKVAHVALVLADDGALELSMWQDRGEDLSAGDAPVRFAQGHNILDATYHHDEPEATEIFARHRDGWVAAEKLDEENLKLGQAIIVGGAATGADLVNLLEYTLQRGARTYVADLVVHDTDRVAAGRDWWVGDLVLAPDRNGAMRRHRIYALEPAGLHLGRRRWNVRTVLDEA